MQNEKNNTQNQNAQSHNPQNRDSQGQSNQQNRKAGESAAINKLSDTEDEKAGDACGCGSSHESGSTGQQQREGHRRDTINQNDENEDAPQRAGAQAGSTQNQPGKEMNESEDETSIPSRVPPGKRMGDQNQQNQPRSQRQLGDPDDEVSADTRRRESAAEDAEKAGTEQNAQSNK